MKIKIKKIPDHIKYTNLKHEDDGLLDYMCGGKLEDGGTPYKPKTFEEMEAIYDDNQLTPSAYKDPFVPSVEQYGNVPLQTDTFDYGNMQIPSKLDRSGNELLKPMTSKSATVKSDINSFNKNKLATQIHQNYELYSGDNPWQGYALSAGADLVGGAMALSALKRASKNKLTPSTYRPQLYNLEAGRNAAKEAYDEAVSSSAQSVKGLTQGQATAVGAATRANLAKAKAANIMESYDKESMANVGLINQASMRNLDEADKIRMYNEAKKTGNEALAMQIKNNMLKSVSDNIKAKAKGDIDIREKWDYINAMNDYMFIKDPKTGKKIIVRKDDPKYS